MREICVCERERGGEREREREDEGEGKRIMTTVSTENVKLTTIDFIASLMLETWVVSAHLY